MEEIKKELIGLIMEKIEILLSKEFGIVFLVDRSGENTTVAINLNNTEAINNLFKLAQYINNYDEQ